MNSYYLTNLYNNLMQKFYFETEYLQAVTEFLESLDDAGVITSQIEEENFLESLLIPDRMISFKVPWYDDRGKLQVNNGYRVQFNNSIGPYKGGLRFHESVNSSIIKFLGFEQCFKNALTGLPLGGGKGGSDFNPKGKSDLEVMRFCHSFMLELSKYIGQFTDIPAGDIGVGKREIGYMYGIYKKITDEYSGVLTGKGISYGGSLGRTEATGYGLCYFTERMLNKCRKDSFKDKKVIISGSGNVAIYAAIKAEDLGGIVIAMSDSDGYVFNPKGLNLKAIQELKEIKKKRIKDYLEYDFKAVYCDDCTQIWNHNCDIALPCATQNELSLENCQQLIKNGCYCIAEGANMPTTLEGVRYLIREKILYAPGKVSNAGGVLVSGLEMTQNSTRIQRSFQEVNQKLRVMMEDLFDRIYQCSQSFEDSLNFVKGSNVLSFQKIYESMKNFKLF